MALSDIKQLSSSTRYHAVFLLLIDEYIVDLSMTIFGIGCTSTVLFYFIFFFLSTSLYIFIMGLPHSFKGISPISIYEYTAKIHMKC